MKRTNAGIELEHQFHGLASHTLAAVSSAGTTNAAFNYSPFGEVVETIDASAGSGTDVHRRRFNDKQHDRLSSLSYYGARYFDAVSVSRSQSDPLFRFSPDSAYSDPRLSNLYSFSKNNPIRYLDPDGRKPLAAHIAETLSNPIVVQAAQNASRGGPAGRGAAAAITAIAIGSAVAASFADESTPVGKLIKANNLQQTVADIVDTYDFDFDFGSQDVVPLSIGNLPTGYDPPVAGNPYRDNPYPDHIPPEKTDKVVPLPPPGYVPLPMPPPGPDPKRLPPMRKLPDRKQPRQLAEKTGSKAPPASTKTAPADGDRDGKVTDDEESNWMRGLQ